MIDWPYGEEIAPDGSAVREIPQRHVLASSVWINADGTAWRRHFNLVSRQWSWDDQPLPLIIDGSQDGVSMEWFTSTDRAVAMAWLYRHPECNGRVHRRACVHLVNGRQSPPPEIRLDTLSWNRGEEPDAEPVPRDERWRALKWRVGAVPCDSRYKISSAGRLRSPSGRITRGFWYDGRRWAAVRGAGLVDLWAAAGLQQVQRIQFAIRTARDALMTGHTPDQLAQVLGVSPVTTWSYFSRAAEYVRGADLRRLVPPLVGQRFWATLVGMRDDPVLGESLTDLMATLQRRKRAPAGDFAWERLRLGRLALLAP